MLQRTVHLATVVFWISVPLLGLVLIFPWLRIDWLQNALTVPVGASAALLLMLSYSPGYVSPVSWWLDGERVVYFLALFYTGATVAF
jgi:cytochrome b subunit of formate dehydrogenase